MFLGQLHSWICSVDGIYLEIPAATNLLRLNDEKLSIPSNYNRIGREYAEGQIKFIQRYWQHLWTCFKRFEISFKGHCLKRRQHCAFAAFSFDPHLSDDMCRQIERMSVFSTNQPTLSLSHYWLTSGGPDLPSSAKKGSNWDQQRVHWYLIREWPITMSWFKTFQPCLVPISFWQLIFPG